MKRLWSGIPGAWSRSLWLRAVVLGVSGLLVLAALSWIAVRWAPDQLASTKGLSGKDRAEEIGRTRTALLAILAGSLAAIGAIYTARTFALNRKGQITERFTRAVEQLGHDQVDVRLGGIYALERLARESREDHGPIMEILTAYVREHAGSSSRIDRASERTNQPGSASESGSAARDEEASPVSAKTVPSTDVQAVLTVLGRRTRTYDTDTLQLEATDLRGAQLRGAHLEGVHLRDAHLEGANLEFAHLEGAVMEFGHLEGADLRHAHLEGAHLRGAHLGGADLTDAHLERADLTDAHLEETNLYSARLQNAVLNYAHLNFANLGAANLEGASLEGAKLERAVETSATRWPDGFNPAFYEVTRFS